MRRYKLGNLATYLFISGDDGSVTHMTLHVPPRSSSSIALSAVSPSLWPLRQILPANPIDDDDDVPCPFPPLNYHESEAREGGSSSTHPAAVVAQKRAQRLQREDFFYTPTDGAITHHRRPPNPQMPPMAAYIYAAAASWVQGRKGGILNLAVLLQSRSSEKNVCTVRRQKQGEREIGATYARALFLSVTSVSCSRNQSLMLPWRQRNRGVGFHLLRLIPVRP